MAKKDPLTDVRRERFRLYCESRGWRHESGRWRLGEVAKALKKKNAYVGNLLNGFGSFGATSAREIEDVIGLPSGYLDGHDDGDFVDVPRLDVRTSAGHGAVSQIEDVIGHLKFSRQFLRSCGVQPGSARVVDVRGASMEPTIRDGAVLLVSTHNREPVAGHVFVLARPSEGLIVKRLARLPDGQWVARSDNREFDDLPINDGEPITIIGRALWMGARL